MSLVISVLLLPVLLMTLSYTLIEAQSSGSSNVNWYKLCKNPIVDSLITEPCHTLTTNGGYTLTPEGERVLACLGGGAVALAAPELAPPLAALKDVSNCGSGSSTSSSNFYSNSFSNNQNDDPITNVLNSLFG